MDVLSTAGLTALLEVIAIDLALAGDNAVVFGLAAAGLDAGKRHKAIVAGVMSATVIRIVFAVVAVYLLDLVGLLLAGGILLLWVCWKMWRELRSAHPPDEDPPDEEVAAERKQPSKSLWSAIKQIVIADVSMSLDNVLAVAGAAREHPSVLVFGLAVSVALMGVAANLVARLLNRHRWIAYIGLAIILYVSIDMVYRGLYQVAAFLW